MARSVTALLVGAALSASIECSAARWETLPDTWGATDALHRSLPTFAEVGPPRADRTVGIFYFLWLGPHVVGGPWDNTRIIANHPGAMTNKNHRAWGPLHAPHHWGESLFGYYLTHDPYVLRKHAQMLSDAGVDVILFDVTNQLTYRSNYLALLRVFAAVRKDGGSTPQVAFLCPFWDPAKVVRELYRDLYSPGIHPELWFRWDGKPMILADPGKLGRTETYHQHDTPAKLLPGHTLGQSFTITNPVEAVEGSFPTWTTSNSTVLLTLYRNGPDGERVLRRRFERVSDNAWLALRPEKPLAPGTYYLEASEATGTIGWWSHSKDNSARGQAHADGGPVPGNRTLRLTHASDDAVRLRQFFTFRRPQPDYFQGQTQPDMWSWLEVFPQHVFTNSLGQKEEMSVGVAQNAVGNRLGSMSEPKARGRSFHRGTFPADTNAVLHGFNLAEQFERALREDPRFIFVTGWNEWIAGRFDQFAGVRYPVMFVDQFDQEHSRDLEPMKGGHGDNYYYQLVSFIRRYKGARPMPKASGPQSIRLDAGFGQWARVQPEFRDDLGDTAHRDFPGWNGYTNFANRSGRNDLVVAKVARDQDHVYFYARSREALTASVDTNWMWLLIDADCDHHTGWEGYDFIANRLLRGNNLTVLERNRGGWDWEAVAETRLVVSGNELQLALPRAALGLGPNQRPLRFDFKWADNVPANGDLASWLDAGDCAPNGRFNYRFQE